MLMAGEYSLATGERFTGIFEKGRVMAGSKGAWADRKGHRYPVTIQRTVSIWEIRDDGHVFTLREKVLSKFKLILLKLLIRSKDLSFPWQV